MVANYLLDESDEITTEDITKTLEIVKKTEKHLEWNTMYHMNKQKIYDSIVEEQKKVVKQKQQEQFQKIMMEQRKKQMEKENADPKKKMEKIPSPFLSM